MGVVSRPNRRARATARNLDEPEAHFVCEMPAKCLRNACEMPAKCLKASNLDEALTLREAKRTNASGYARSTIFSAT